MGTVVRTEGLSKRYGRAVALDSLDLDIEQGEVFGYLWPNGAGKSTTIALLLGLIRPSSGGARILGLDPGVARRPSTDAWPRAERGRPVAVADG